ncbi:MAG: NifU family protein [Gemmatimonadota bacterium]|nr:NifU family protein [Gemmatimonadota bacterium]
MAFLESRRGRSIPDIEAQVRAELEALRPLLGVDHCAIALARFDAVDGTAVLHIEASCSACDASGATFLPGIETRLMLRVAEVRRVRVEGKQ